MTSLRGYRCSEAFIFANFAQLVALRLKRLGPVLVHSPNGPRTVQTWCKPCVFGKLILRPFTRKHLAAARGGRCGTTAEHQRHAQPENPPVPQESDHGDNERN